MEKPQKCSQFLYRVLCNSGTTLTSNACTHMHVTPNSIRPLKSTAHQLHVCSYMLLDRRPPPTRSTRTKSSRCTQPKARCTSPPSSSSRSPACWCSSPSSSALSTGRTSWCACCWLSVAYYCANSQAVWVDLLYYIASWYARVSVEAYAWSSDTTSSRAVTQ